MEATLRTASELVTGKPADRLDLVQKYGGVAGKKPSLDRLGGPEPSAAAPEAPAEPEASDAEEPAAVQASHAQADAAVNRLYGGTGESWDFSTLNALAQGEHPKPIFIADGHHRSAAGTRIRAIRRDANPGHTGEEPYNFFLSVVFPDDQMLIMDYNRVVRDLNGLDERDFLAAVAEKFEVSPMDLAGKPESPKVYSMYLGGRWFRLVAREGSYPAEDPVRRLDVAILQENLLAPVLDVEPDCVADNDDDRRAE